MVQDCFSVTLKLRPLEGLCHAVPFHFVCGAAFYVNVSLLYLIRHKKVPDVDVSGSLTHALVPILLQLNCTRVVLENNVGLRFMSLRL